jgi:hypothetical protein
MLRVLPGLILVGLLLCGPGCSSTTAPKPPAVQPTVIQLTFKGTGQPVTEGTVELGSATDANLNGHAAPDDNGACKVHTIFGNKKLEGAAEGTFKVIYIAPQGPDQSTVPPQELGTITVKAGETNTFPFQVTPRQR